MAKQIRKGDSGPDVSTLQTILNSLGYKCGTVDGIFGSKTDAAIRSFQSDHNLTSDGIVGTKTWSALNSNSSTNIKTITNQHGDTFAVLGDADNMSEGDALVFPGEYTINQIQSKLDSAYKKAPDIIQDRAKRVRYLINSSMEKMKKMYITEGKIITSSNIEYPKKEIKSITYKETTRPTEPRKTTKANTSTSTNVTRNRSILRYGDSGADVRELQQQLKDLMYYLGAVDGVFGKLTTEAVMRIQDAAKLKVDGIVGSKTRAAIQLRLERLANLKSSNNNRKPDLKTIRANTVSDRYTNVVVPY